MNLLEELAGNGCAVAFIDEGIDTSTAAGTMHSQILSAVAQFERNRISERTRSGRRAAAEAGRFVGSTPPYGYRVTGGHGDRHLVVEETQARAIRLIYRRLVVERVQAKHVAAELNESRLPPALKDTWDAATLRRWAKDEGHIRNAAGTWTFDGVDVPIPPILTPTEAAVWRAWSSESRSNFPARAPQTYLLSDFVRMPCGRRAMGRTVTGQEPTYSCRDRLTAGVPGHLDCKNLHAPTLESTVIHEVRARLLQPAVLRAAVSGASRGVSAGTQLVQLQQELDSLDDSIAEEMALLRESGLRRESVARVLRPLKDQQEGLQAKARALRRRLAEEAAGPGPRQIREAVDQLSAGLATDEPALWRQVLDTLNVVVHIVEHVECDECGGSGYLALPPGQGRRWAQRCPGCLRGKVPVLEIEMDDVVALAVADGLQEVG
ncbi:hypothetical protein FNH13_17585 [Ornithinimicrobium ciconiae]|uniref:Recombinase family protein n=1 Tax=Ornithinimicrobium ciconiae TaxID=2594265 RepID=A0A516GEF3_9MICO|nr:hypothetical protein FNH13_17585 [Ornithinimicrobium ciconiae]